MSSFKDIMKEWIRLAMPYLCVLWALISLHLTGLVQIQSGSVFTGWLQAVAQGLLLASIASMLLCILTVNRIPICAVIMHPIAGILVAVVLLMVVVAFAWFVVTLLFMMLSIGFDLDLALILHSLTRGASLADLLHSVDRVINVGPVIALILAPAVVLFHRHAWFHFRDTSEFQRSSFVIVLAMSILFLLV